MSFLNADIANLLQLFTFPVELLGLTLAAIEIKVPTLRVKISKYIRESAWNRDFLVMGRTGQRAKHFQKYPDSQSDLIPDVWFFFTEKMIHLPALKWLVFIVIVSAIVQLISGSLEMWRSWWLYTLAIGIPLAYLIPSLLVRVAELIVKFDQNRIVGTVGLCIAAVALLGEAYQFFTQLFA